MPSVISEPVRAGEFLVSEANGYRSREAIIIANTTGAEVTFGAGLVLAQRAVGAATSAAKSGGNTGNATMSAVTVGPGAKVGVYTVRMTAATAFTVRDPDGFMIGTGATGVAFADDIVFTMTAGGTPMVAGDGFDVTMAAGDLAYVPFTNATNLPAAAVLYGPVTVPATSTGRGTGIVRDAEVNAHALQYDSSLSGGGLTAAKTAAALSLKAAGLIIRS
ncbi:head decoration protein [Falsiroseomonas tokyonensis]|uniref:Head decoration protein n=1 Tax=Falsiroseomonas tokyonensis TaxID=430521 RepID=A0ABV7C2D0_9PROT|nr:head decoration protein [Falsiroseomonas tokyonensis]MBU8540821.1 head decoration protein [Falsiroseomonas tokyonensis]